MTPLFALLEVDHDAELHEPLLRYSDQAVDRVSNLPVVVYAGRQCHVVRVRHVLKGLGFAVMPAQRALEALVLHDVPVKPLPLQVAVDRL